MPAFTTILQSFEGLFSLGIAGSIGAGVMKFLDWQRAGRKDTIGQLNEIIASKDKELTAEKAAVARKDIENIRLLKAGGKLQIVITSLQARIDLLETANTQLHLGADPFLINQFVNPVAQIGMDEAGNILDAEPKIRPILHYTAAELKKMNVRQLIPSEFQEKHKEFMKRAGDDTIVLDQRNILALELMNREGSRVPVNLRILRWKEEGQRRFGIYVQERDVLPNGNGSNGGSHSGDSGAFLKAGDPAGERETKEISTVTAAPGPAKGG